LCLDPLIHYSLYLILNYRYDVLSSGFGTPDNVVLMLVTGVTQLTDSHGTYSIAVSLNASTAMRHSSPHTLHYILSTTFALCGVSCLYKN
jgi:hypothetical protein